MKKHIKSVLIRTAACFTLTVSVFCVIMLAIGAGAGEDEPAAALSASRTLLFLPFSLIWGIASTILNDSGKLSRTAAYAIHALLMIPGTYLCLILPIDIENNASGSDRFMHFFFTAVIYLAVILTVSLVRRSLKRTLEKDREFRKPKA